MANAALRGEQRRPPNLNHCAVITEAESNPNAERWESLLNALLCEFFMRPKEVNVYTADRLKPTLNRT